MTDPQKKAKSLSKDENSLTSKKDTLPNKNKELVKKPLLAHDNLRIVNEEQEATILQLNKVIEELKIARAELQSFNLNLTKLNQELLDKQEQLMVTSHYAESIVATVREPLIILDETLRVKTASAAFYKVFNAEASETEGKSFYEIQNKQWDDRKMRALFEKILPEKESLSDFEIILKFPLLGERNLLMNARKMVNETTSEQLILLAIEDVTELKAAALKRKTFTEELEQKVKERTAELKKSNEELKQTNIQLEQFAHIASHDLQEPLRKIATFTSHLQNKHAAEMNEEVKLYLNKIEGASNRMTTLIRDLLNYSSLLQHERVFVRTDLNITLTNIVNDFELLIRDKKAEIKTETLPSIDAIPLQMNQLFYNLISNALKFSREGVPPIISVTSRLLSATEIRNNPNLNPMAAYAEITFKDNGIGFEQKYAERIFTIFQRLHDKETFVGTGIGLALSKKIVENHYGEVFADAKENIGAVFYVRIPIVQIK